MKSFKTTILTSILFFFFLGLTHTQNTFQIIPNSGSKSTENELTYSVNFPALTEQLSKTENISLKLPLINSTKEIILQPTQILADNYQLFSSKGAQNTKNKYRFYHGYIKGQPASKVALTLVDNQHINMAIFDKDGNFELYPSDKEYKGVFQSEQQTKTEQEWACDYVVPTTEDLEKYEKSYIQKTTPDSNCTTIFLEVDHNMYNKKGSISNTENWVVSLMNQVMILYIEWNVPLTISGIQVWDTPDPYVSATSTSEALNLFRTAVHNNPNFNGRLGHLLSGRSLGGGIAYLSSLCSSYTNVAVSANLKTNAISYPTYSWNVMVIAHELGHNFGSRHTHDCAWNGNGTAIDGCYGAVGGCSTPPKPPSSVGGTIMSYCHLNVGINLANGFGEQPGELIQYNFENANCATGANCVAVPPFHDVCSRATEIGVFDHCINGAYHNINATPSGQGGNTSCGNGVDDKDVWFKFHYSVDLDSVRLELSGTPYDSTDFIAEFYTGTCNNLNSIYCETINSDTSFVTFNDTLLRGEDIFIRIVEDGSDETIKFNICIYAEELPCYEHIDTLLNFYTELDGDNWTDNSGWYDGFYNGDCNYCDWFGITCDRNGRITEINLSNNNLTGDFSTIFLPFEKLKTVNLRNNSILGKLPLLVYTSRYLETLDLAYNNFSDTIPENLFKLSRLRVLYLDNNNLTGELPNTSINVFMRSFSASNNDLTGCFIQGLTSLCSRDSLNLDNNPNMVYGGDITELCENYFGTDYDKDGYCRGIEDCNDYNENINPAADEIDCDGIDNNCNLIVDENSDPGPNVWIGPDTLGIWNDSMNWSMGHLPKICEFMEIGTNGDTIHIDFETAQYTNLNLKNLVIGPHVTMIMDTTFGFNIETLGTIENHGTLILDGYISMYNQDTFPDVGFINYGNLIINPQGGLYINEIKQAGIYNYGNFIMNGSCYIGNYNSETPLSGIINEGTIEIGSFLSLDGYYQNGAIISKGNSETTILQTGSIQVYEY